MSVIYKIIIDQKGGLPVTLKTNYKNKSRAESQLKRLLSSGHNRGVIVTMNTLDGIIEVEERKATTNNN